MRSLLFWTALPFVLPQALLLRRNAPRFAAATGPLEGAAGTGREYSLLAIGDSIIAGVGASRLEHALVGQTARALAEALDARVGWIARGRIGASSKSLGESLAAALPARKADFLILSVGVNDVTSVATLASWEKRLTAILASLTAHSPEAIIAVAGIPPLGGFPLLPQPLRAVFGLRGHSFDRAARRVIGRFPQAVHVPVEFDTSPARFAADGFHPSESGYREFGQEMARALLRRFEAEGS